MIKLEHVVLVSPEQMEFIIEGMRNPMNSWEKSDSYTNYTSDIEDEDGLIVDYRIPYLRIGSADNALMLKLSNAGTDHRKFMRMMPVYVRITAPLYWWKEFDTYKVATVANSCSTMHKIQEKEFTLADFSCEHLITDWIGDNNDAMYHWDMHAGEMLIPLFASPIDGLKVIIGLLNSNREAYLKTKDKKYWWQMIQLLPSSYNQTRNVMLNYEVLANIYKSRKNHRLDEWRVHETPEEHKFRNKDFTSGKWGFCDWIETLPYSELITGNVTDKENE